MDLGVNLAGVEIILNMREKMDAMQREFERFFSTCRLTSAEFSNFTRTGAAGSESLVPVKPLRPGSTQLTLFDQALILENKHPSH